MGRAEIFLLALFSSSLVTKVFKCSSFSRCHFTCFLISPFLINFRFRQTVGLWITSSNGLDLVGTQMLKTLVILRKTWEALRSCLQGTALLLEMIFRVILLTTKEELLSMRNLR